MIKVSIIIPLLNSIQFLEECIDSVRRQTLQEIEIIFVDAGSTDGSLQLISQFMANDISRMILLHSEKKSYGHQVNLGIHASKGEYIGIVESDDKVSDEFFQNLYDKTNQGDQNATSQFRPDFVKGGFTHFGTVFGKHVYEKVTRTDNQMDKLLFLNHDPSYRLFDPVHIWSGIYKRSFLSDKKIELNPTPGASYQDTSFSLLVGLLAETCIYTKECGYFYRIDNDQSSVKANDKVSCIMDEYEFLYRNMQLAGILDGQNKNIVEHYKLTSYFWNFRRMSEKGRKEFLKLIEPEMAAIELRETPLSQADKEVLKYLSDPNGAAEFTKVEESLEREYTNFLELILKRQKFIILTRKSNVRRLYFIQEITELDFIKKIYLSNKSDQVEHQITLNDNTNHFYTNEEILIVGKNNSESIKADLLSQGVDSGQIHILKYLPSFSWIVDHLKSNV
ncbi:MAG: glycosyltransferase family 2 protein [Lachnospiraceae bacterium]